MLIKWSNWNFGYNHTKDLVSIQSGGNNERLSVYILQVLRPLFWEQQFSNNIRSNTAVIQLISTTCPFISTNFYAFPTQFSCLWLNKLKLCQFFFSFENATRIEKLYSIFRICFFRSPPQQWNRLLAAFCD